MATILHALTRTNAAVDGSQVPPGTNTSCGIPTVHFDNWRPWEEFNYSTLTAIFRDQLNGAFHGSPDPVPLPLDLVVINEETLEDALRRFISPAVNYALATQVASPHYGRGSRIPLQNGKKPDWSVVVKSTYGQYFSIVTGDTKLSVKWWPEQIYANYGEWEKPVQQVVDYMAELDCRFGFIITDTCLVVLRLTRFYTGDGLAANRPQRQAAVHQRYASDATGVSIGSSYSENEIRTPDYHDPEYAVIPWGATGQGQLTIKLALWCLAMMAVGGGHSIDYAYPPLNLWEKGSNGYVNCATGRDPVPLFLTGIVYLHQKVENLPAPLAKQRVVLVHRQIRHMTMTTERRRWWVWKRKRGRKTSFGCGSRRR